MSNSTKLNRGKFGPRYGYTPVLKHLKVLKQYEGRFSCVNCNYDRVMKRTCAGIWACKKCGYCVASGAYSLDVSPK